MAEKVHVSRTSWHEITEHVEAKSLSYLFATLGNSNMKETNMV